ncbi:unnamed protein product [Natator depressus]
MTERAGCDAPPARGGRGREARQRRGGGREWEGERALLLRTLRPQSAGTQTRGRARLCQESKKPRAPVPVAGSGHYSQRETPAASRSHAARYSDGLSSVRIPKPSGPAPQLGPDVPPASRSVTRGKGEEETPRPSHARGAGLARRPVKRSLEWETRSLHPLAN